MQTPRTIRYSAFHCALSEFLGAIGLRVTRLAATYEPDIETPKFIEQLHVMAYASRQPIEAVDENLIDAAAANEGKQAVQPRTVERRSGVAEVVEALRQQRPSVFALRLQVERAGLLLNLTRGQSIGRTHRLAGVDGAPNRPSVRRLLGGMEH